MIQLQWKPIRFSAVFLLLSMLLFASTSVSAQEMKQEEKSKLHNLIPDYVKLQYAGGIGFMSAGVGYTFFKQRLDVSMFYGYVPKAFSIDDLHSISLQLTAKLLHIKLNDKLELLPLNFGWYAHHTFGNDFWVRLPDKYAKDYYWWSPGRNAGVFIGAELKTKLLASKSPASGTAFYVRIGSRGLYIASKAGNKTIPFTDILEFGFGVAIYR
jgi:hypothetical protein